MRARLFLEQALADAGARQKLQWKPLNLKLAALAYNWTTAAAADRYPVTAQGDAVQVSQQMLAKYRPYFQSCS